MREPRTSVKSVVTRVTKMKLKQNTAARIAAARRNLITASRRRPPIMSVDEILNTRGIVLRDTGNMVTIKMSRDIILKLKDLYLTSQREMSEYVGLINVKREGELLTFNSPTRHTNRQPNRVLPPPGTTDNLIVYHSHPVPVARQLSVSTVTLPSMEDFTFYVDHYPRMQANIILERNGYYMIDLLESNTSRLPNPRSAHDTFINLLRNKDINRYFVVYTRVPTALFSVSIDSWQRMFNVYIDRVMRHMYGMSIKYYRYNELPEITLLNPASVVPIRPS